MERIKCRERGQTARASLKVVAVAGLLCGCATSMQITGARFADGDPLKICVDDPAACGENFHQYAARDKEWSGQFGAPFYCSVEGPMPDDPAYNPYVEKKHSLCVQPQTLEKRKGTYLLKTAVNCGINDEQTVTLDAPWTGNFTVQSPKPIRAFLKSSAKVGLFPLSVKMEFQHGDHWKTAAAFTEVEVLRDWSARNGECYYSVAKIIDAGGLLPPGTLVVVPKEELTDTRPEGATASASIAKAHEQAQLQKQENAAAQAESAKVSAAETKSGRCTPERHALLERVLNSVTPLFTGSDYSLVEHWTVAGAGGPRPLLNFRTGLGGQYSFVSFGFEPLGLEVKRPDGSVVGENPNPYAQTLARNAWDGSIESRAAIANPLAKYSLSLKGSGCALVMVLYNHDRNF